MLFRLIFLLVLFCFGCQSGKIPCPKVKAVKYRKSAYAYHASPSLITASVDQGAEKSLLKTNRTSSQKDVNNVTVEEWDCPRPATRRYMPKSVKQNIRKNFRQIQRSAADSVAVN